MHAGVYVAAQGLKNDDVAVNWGAETKASWSGGSVSCPTKILRLLATKSKDLYSTSALQKTEVSPKTFYPLMYYRERYAGKLIECIILF